MRVGKTMTPDRLEIVRLVIAGKLSEDHITMEEVREIHQMVVDAILDRMSETNPMVFYGTDNKTIN
jgi:hypothetical protein